VVVAGFDGSDAARDALRFALEEARLRGLPLRIVCAWEIPALEYAGAAMAPTPDLADEAQAQAERAVAQARELVGDDDPGVAVEAVAVPGHAADVLLEQAAGAALLVVGSRGHGALARLVLGSVSQAVAHGARCPVAIVPAAHS
jgi:nucleotide-binding universal stress UspA family protein